MLKEHFENMRARYQELLTASAQPDTLKDIALYQKTIMEMKELEEPLAVWEKYKGIEDSLSQAKELLSDPAMEELAEEEINTLSKEEENLHKKLKEYLIPQDPDDKRNVIIEIRPGAGGDEAGLFAGILLRMYTRYADRKGFTVDINAVTDNTVGGIKEAVLTIKGVGAFSRLKFESGVHRVQRVPATESQGRIHTSTATVAVLPEMDEVDVEINQNDLRVDVYRSSGHGGQSVNTTDSAVRITHLPTGLVVTCQNEKSQLKNKETALKVLASRLYDIKRSERDEKYAAQRRGQLGTGDRSERIRTYNFPQGRVTDHRINLTLYKIDDVTDGDLDEIIDALTVAMREEQAGTINA
ncbi:MAG: peptide chain release factor 1 [Eubacteriales bacterium]|nr:peptide chain release factor 1 [Eubacteriales bacterium]